MKKLKVIKTMTLTPCYCCNPHGTATKRSICKVCKGTRQYKEYHYYHIYIGKNGQRYCIDKDTLG